MNVRAIIVAAIAALALTANALAADSTWKADPVHSSATFTAIHLGISKVVGTIPIKSATLTIPNGSNVPASVQAFLDPSGLDTHVQMRDDDLRSNHFFDVAQFPVMSFTSTSITATDDKHITINGNLTMHGVTKPVTLGGLVSCERARDARRNPRGVYGERDHRSYAMGNDLRLSGGQQLDRPGHRHRSGKTIGR